MHNMTSYAQCDYVTFNETNYSLFFLVVKSHTLANWSWAFSCLLIDEFVVYDRLLALHAPWNLLLVKWEAMHHSRVAKLPLLVPSYAAKLPRQPSFYSAMLVRPRPSVSHTNLDQYGISTFRLSLAYSRIQQQQDQKRDGLSNAHLPPPRIFIDPRLR